MSTAKYKPRLAEKYNASNCLFLETILAAFMANVSSPLIER